MKKSKRLLAFLLAAVILTALIVPSANAANKPALQKRVVGYFPAYRYSSALNSVDYSALSHVILSFLRYDNQLTCDFTDSQIRAIKEKCDAAGTKLMIAVGGGSGFTYEDNPIDTAADRTKFVDSLMYYVDTFDLDGIDIDIEITNEDFWPYFDEMISELSEGLKAKDKLLTMAVSPWFTDGIQSSTYQYFDFLNLMAYDDTDTYDSLKLAQREVMYYRARGVSDDRMTIGVPFYGQDEKGNSYRYADIIAGNKDALSQSSSHNSISYDGIPSITAKAEYSLSFGGIMIWEVGQDDFDPQYSLLQAIKNVYMVSGNGVAPVTELTADHTTKTSTSLRWTASPDAVSYDIYNGATYVGSTSQTSLLVRNLDSGEIYTFRVFAVNGDGVKSIAANFNVQTNLDAGSIPEWSAGSTYLKGSQVVYNGSVYMAKWWTNEGAPGSTQVGSGAWTHMGQVGSSDLEINVKPFEGGTIEQGSSMAFRPTVYGSETVQAYQYYVVKDGVVVLRKSVASGSFMYTFREQGSYQIYAYCKDAAGNKASSIVTISVV